MNMGFEKLVVAINNICVSSSQTNKYLLNKLDTLTSCMKTLMQSLITDYEKFKTTILQEFLKMN